MNEADIAYKKVIPYLKSIGFDEGSIDGYGRVPVQIGRTVVWADIVCSIYLENNSKVPFAVIEVKKDSDNNINFAIPQAESYAQRLGTPYFCCTNGESYKWFMTGGAQGENIPLIDCPTLPCKEYMQKPEKIYISAYLYEAIANYEVNVNTQGRIFKDCKWHNDTTESLNKLLWNSKLIQNKNKAIDIINNNTMKSRGKQQLLKNIENEYSKFINMIDYLKNSSILIEERITNCIGVNSKYGISGGGIFFITEMLAGLYPREYTVIEQNAINAMHRFKLIDIFFSVENAQEYIFFNNICRELFKYFKNSFEFNLSYVHNFLWHYEKEFIVNKSWD
ncbi:type I restriction enzyme HsdR N-terminal domain-containing protein [Clostridium guangxiense]|uniref:type I restriction enzyme HsdR N-terminal domain-containing protein n=1 Tax=Clostridium guangxiense TaxID=1662055 RepID=UPI001E59CABF|nr:type I restriction enzyme HsdR N-terminal domain-containing protein [Clostridium guangxiense]MCD2347165.1 type I restriction enzyme HsdR N-terminal domain-containing protein [Clostridium guangxiense]